MALRPRLIHGLRDVQASPSPLPPFVHIHGQHPCLVLRLGTCCRNTEDKSRLRSGIVQGACIRNRRSTGISPVREDHGRPQRAIDRISGSHRGLNCNLGTAVPSTARAGGHQASLSERRQRCIGRAPPPADSPTPAASRQSRRGHGTPRRAGRPRGRGRLKPSPRCPQRPWPLRRYRTSRVRDLVHVATDADVVPFARHRPGPRTV